MADNTTGNKGKGGFASMDEDRQREIASMGGRAAHESGNAHEFTPEEAREAGRKGGEAPHNDRGTSQAASDTSGSTQGGSHEQHVEAGRKGGEARSEGTHDSTSSQERGGSHDQHVEAGRQSHKNS